MFIIEGNHVRRARLVDYLRFLLSRKKKVRIKRKTEFSIQVGNTRKGKY